MFAQSIPKRGLDHTWDEWDNITHLVPAERASQKNWGKNSRLIKTKGLAISLAPRRPQPPDCRFFKVLTFEDYFQELDNYFF